MEQKSEIVGEIPHIDTPSEPLMLGVPGTPTDGQTAKKVLASQTHKLSARMFVEAYLAGEYVKFIVLLRDVIKEAYQRRFISSRCASESIHYAEEIITMLRQFDIQDKVLKDNPEILSSFASMVESVNINQKGILELGFKCDRVVRGSPKSTAEMMEICRKCGKRDEDQRRVLDGKERLCPISISLTDYFGDTADLPVIDTFKSNVSQWGEKWYEQQLVNFKNLLESYRSIDRSWHTQSMKLQDEQIWRMENPIGQAITENLHIPLIEFTHKIIFVKEESNWRRWLEMKEQLKKEEEKMKRR